MNRFQPEKDLLKDLSFRLLAEGKMLRIRSDGYSMYPQIKPGSFLLIEPVPDASVLKENDIVAWKRSSGMVVHRLIRIENSESSTKYITRGDSCLREDEELGNDQIVGRVIRIATGDKFEKNNLIYSDKINYKLNHLIVKLLLIRDKIHRIFDY